MSSALSRISELLECLKINFTSGIGILRSFNNLNTRLLNLKKINKSLDTFVSKTNSLNWDELQKINQEFQSSEEKIEYEEKEKN